ncbi:MAG: hypothetical protein NC078_10890, partial [Ruminococcus sp.]|nr:hypothetical protein [Ruminococcus sp.]
HLRANALLSAIGLSADKPDEISEPALIWLSEKSNTISQFFIDGDYAVGKSSAESIKSIAESYLYYYKIDLDLFMSEHTEAADWERNYEYLFNLSVERAADHEYISEIFEAFAQYPNEHADIMAYIRQGLNSFESARQKRMSKRTDEAESIKGETA